MKNNSNYGSNWNSTNLNSTWNGSVVPTNISESLMTINLANMTFLVNQLTEYDETAQILWIYPVAYSILSVVDYTKTPDMWAFLNQTAI